MTTTATQSYRLDNISFGGYDISTLNANPEYSRADQTVRVHEGIAKVGDIVQIDGEKYLVSEVSADAKGIELAKSSAAQVLRQGKTLKNVLVFPLGSTDNTTPIDAHKALNKTPNINNIAAATWSTRASTPAVRTDEAEMGYRTEDVVRTSTTPTPKPNDVKGASQDAFVADENGILPFARFAGTLAFRSFLQSSFSQTSTESVHSYLTTLMSKFYHQLYYIPNLKDANAIVVKPETLFVAAPSCNLIFPNIKYSISYSRTYKQEPTRLMHKTDPIAALAGSARQTPFELYSFMFVEDNPDTVTRDGVKVYSNYIEGLDSGHTKLTDREKPLTNITNFEQRNGIRCSNVNKGADIYLYLASRQDIDTDTTYTGGNKNDTATSGVQIVGGSAETLNSIGQTLGRLAKYELARQRYVTRSGTVATYFNPYVVPGFPMASIETTAEGLNIYGYVTAVVHNLTDNDWSTTISFNCAHDDLDAPPNAFPIIESEYTQKLAETYKDMLGDSITPVTNDDIPTLIDEYGNDKNYITQSYRKIWRETTSLDDYLKLVADDATIIEDNGYMWLKNAEGSRFFNEDVQARLREYTEQIMVTHRAFHADDVR